jgi:uncharacterized protein YvpB
MKNQQIRITFLILLSSIILSSFRFSPDQQSVSTVKSAPTGGDIEVTLIGEDHDVLSLIENQTPTKISRMRKRSRAKFNMSHRAEEILVSDPMAEKTNTEASPNQDLVSPQSPISGDIRIDEGFITRLPMEDQYHSQITETSLPNACGPTSLMMVLDYFDLEESLQDIIQKLQYSPAQGGYDPSCTANPVCTSPGALVQVAQEEYGLLVDAHEGWTLYEIQESIAAGKPIIADIVWRLADEGPGHFVVIYGIDIEQEMLFYHDPYDGAEKTASWEEFSIAWDGPVDLGDPIQPQGYQFWGMSLTNG